MHLNLKSMLPKISSNFVGGRGGGFGRIWTQIQSQNFSLEFTLSPYLRNLYTPTLSPPLSSQLSITDSFHTILYRDKKVDILQEEYIPPELFDGNHFKNDKIKPKKHTCIQYLIFLESHNQPYTF